MKKMLSATETAKSIVPSVGLSQSERSTLVPEMPLAGEDHGDAVLVRRGDDFIIATGTARLDDCGNARLGRPVNRVIEREKCVCCEHAAASAITGFLEGDFDRIDAAHLAGAYADRRQIPD